MATKKRDTSRDLRLVGETTKLSKAAIEARFGLPPGAIGTTHRIDEAGVLLDAEGHFVGLTAAAPGGIANWLKIILLDYAFGATAPAAGSTPLYLGLGTGTFTGGLTDIGYLQNGISNEVPTTNWTDYARAPIANTAAQWTGATGVAATQVATKTNTNAIVVAANAHVTGTGPTPTWYFLTRSLAGNLASDLYAVGGISSGSAAVANGAQVSFPAGALTINLT